MSSAPSIEHDASNHRFVARLDAGDAYLAYEPAGARVLDLQHTVVPEEARGAGVGEALVRAALDHARASDRQVIPSCPFVAAWLDKHPDDQSLVARE